MHVLIGIVVVMAIINALGWVFWALAGAGAVIAAAVAYAQWKEEQSLPPEIRAERQGREEEARQARRERRAVEEHCRRMLALQQQQLDAERKAQAKHAVLGTAGKIAAGIAVSMLTGGNHRHRH